MRIVVLAVSLALAGCASEGAAKPEPVAPRPDVRAEIVAASVFGYRDPCPCPYSKEGTCKGKSAYDRAKMKRKPRCFKVDVKPGDVKRWRELLRESAERQIKWHPRLADVGADLSNQLVCR
jgi:hypothetical protein